MRLPAAIAAAGLLLTACTEIAEPMGVVATAPGDLQRVAYDETTEARRLAKACLAAEAKGVDALGFLTREGYQYMTGLMPLFVKEAPQNASIELVHSIGVRKRNNESDCAIIVRPHTHGASVLAVVTDEIQRQGWTRTPAPTEQAELFTRDGRTVAVRASVPGGVMRYSDGAEISISKR
ncbi:hypothetical protein [Paracoccus jeotgali]|uniref:hypothetical protein n=1 Tax=Paracoccus jeotgali TaxID=2065379 RepID=UPI0028AE1030|nr:hypothetical protein [Paracoccus jeotgali]